MTGSTAFQRARGKPYAETFRCPGGALCLDFCNSGQNARGPSGAEWIAGFSDLVELVKSGKAHVKISGTYRSSKLAPDYADIAPLARALIAGHRFARTAWLVPGLSGATARFG